MKKDKKRKKKCKKRKYISKIKVGDYVEFGKQIKKWSETCPHRRPRTIGEVRKELARTDANVKFPKDRFDDDTPVTFVDSRVKCEWVVRLPAPELIAESVKRIRDGCGYPIEQLPRYYYDYIISGKEYDEDFLYSRIADYTISQCA